MSIKNDFPSIHPTLNLDFANSKNLDSRVSFTRNSTATYYDGDEHALAEQNLCPYSQNFSVWTQTGTTITSDSLIAPDGTTTADTMVNTAIADSHLVGFSPIRVNPGTTYTVSIFVKRNTVDFFQIAAILDTDSTRANFDILNGTAGSTGNTLTATSTITAYPNSWYRCTMTVTAPTTVNPANYISIYFCHVQSNTAAIFESYLGTTSQSSYIWGAQLEQRSAAAAYVPTTNIRVTNYIPRLLTAGTNVPRFDHDPITGESLGLLIEESRTNLLTRSQEFDNAAWIKQSGSITTNTNISPDGTLTADSLIEDTNNSQHYIYQSRNGSNETLTFSVYAKAASRSSIILQLSNQVNYAANIYFDLLNSSIIATSAISPDYTNISGSITNVGNGWCKCSITATKGAVNTTNAPTIVLLQSNNVTSAYTGDGRSGVYLWGAQLESGSFPTSYIPTTTAAVTRPADIAVIDGTNFSSWFNNEEGTFYCELAKPKRTDINRPGVVFSTIDTDIQNSIYVTTRGNFYVFVNSLPQVALNPAGSNSMLENKTTKLAFTYKINNFAAVINGNNVSIDTSGAVTRNLQSCSIGTEAWNVGNKQNFINGCIRKFSFYPQRLSNLQIKTLTKS